MIGARVKRGFFRLGVVLAVPSVIGAIGCIAVYLIALVRPHPSAPPGFKPDFDLIWIALSLLGTGVVALLLCIAFGWVLAGFARE